MNKKQSASKISKEEIKEVQNNKILVDQTFFKADRNGKVTYSKKPFSNLSV